MATTNFVNGVTPVVADWLNDADAHIYNQQVAAHSAANISVSPSGEISATDVQTALGEIVSDTNTKLAAKANIAGQVFTGHIEVPAGASGSQVPRASELQSILGITGQVAFFAKNSAPAGWLKANGAAVSRVTYAALFAAVGTTFGAGDGSTTFNLPDMRGYAPRGWDDGRGVDSGRAFGSEQADNIRQSSFWLPATQSGNGSLINAETGAITVSRTTSNPWSVQAVSTAGTRSDVTIGSAPETRMKNIALLACIKF